MEAGAISRLRRPGADVRRAVQKTGDPTTTHFRQLKVMTTPRDGMTAPSTSAHVG